MVLARGESAEYTLGDLDEELAERLAHPGDAKAAARWYRRQLVRSFVPLIKDARHDRRRASLWPGIPDRGRSSSPGSVLQDLRYSARSFARQPGLSLTVLITLALGIGANTAVFSVVSGVLLRSLPYDDAKSLVVLATLDEQSGDTSTSSGQNYLDWSERNETLAGTYAWMSGGRTLTGGTDREQVDLGQVTPGFLDVLKVVPLHGRGFLADELGPGSPPVALLQYDFWQRRYGGDPSAVGTQIELDGERYEVIGVAPPGFRMPLTRVQKDLWINLRTDWSTEDRDFVYLSIVGRLKDGVSLSHAREDLAQVHAGIRAAYPGTTVNTGVAVAPLKGELIGDVRPALLALMGSVGFLLLLACTNVANLFLVRAAGRGTELGVRAALGAGRRRLTRQLLTESALVSAVAGVLGVVAGLGGIQLLVALAPDNLPRIHDVSVDLPVLGFSVLATALTGLLFGAAPALYATRRDPIRLLRGAGRGQFGGRSLRRLREALVVAEIAAAVILVVAAGLLGRSFGAILAVDPGFDRSNLVLAEVALPVDRYPDADGRAGFHRGLMAHLDASSAIEAVGGVWNAPMNQAVVTVGLQIEGRSPPDPGMAPSGELRIATGGYFAALQIPLLEGRVFAETDVMEGPSRVMISRLLAEELWPGESPIGRRVSLDIFESDGVPDWHEVIGVVGDVRLNGLDDAERGLIYIAYSQRPQTWITVTARTRGEPEVAAALVRDMILDFEPLVPQPEITTMTGRVADTLAARRFYLTLLGTFAGIALVLASVGIYGVSSYAVSSRTNEIGVRVAFGASRRRILREVLNEGMRVAGIGIALGLAGAWALSRALRSLVFGVSTGDPVTYAGVVALLAAVAFIACIVPAVRAASTEPLDALRYE